MAQTKEIQAIYNGNTLYAESGKCWMLVGKTPDYIGRFNELVDTEIFIYYGTIGLPMDRDARVYNQTHAIELMGDFQPDADKWH